MCSSDLFDGRSMQRRGERVARKALHAAPVEAKADRPIGVGQQTAGDTPGTARQRVSPGGGDNWSSGPPTA